MGILSNFIGAAAGAGGEIMQKQREADVAVQSQKTLADYNNELALKRDEVIRQAREAEGIRSEGRAEDRTVAGEKREILNRATERQNIVDETVANAPKLREVKVADAKASEMAKYDPEIEALRTKAETGRLTATEQAKLDFYTKNEGAIRKQTRDEARDKHIDTGAGLRAIQMQTEQLKLDLAKTEAKIPPAVKLLAAPISKEIDTISSALAKAQAEGMFDPNSESGKALLMRQADANKRLGDLVSPYLGDKAPKPVATDGLDKDLASRIAALSASKGGAKPGATKTEAPKAAQPSDPPRDQGARNPDIDASGRPLPRPPGDDSNAWQRTVKPGIVGTVDSVNQAGASAMKTYLSEKIARKEPLSPSEQVRAKQFGLLK